MPQVHLAAETHSIQIFRESSVALSGDGNGVRVLGVVGGTGVECARTEPILPSRAALPSRAHDVLAAEKRPGQRDPEPAEGERLQVHGARELLIPEPAAVFGMLSLSSDWDSCPRTEVLPNYGSTMDVDQPVQGGASVPIGAVR